MESTLVQMAIASKLVGDKKKKCDCCGGPVSFVTNDVVFGATAGDWPYIYLCDDETCGARVGCHLDTDKPLGIMADARTRKARQYAHDAFNQLFKLKVMTRTEAYAWLASELRISVHDCHIGMFNVKQCERTINAVMQSGLLQRRE